MVVEVEIGGITLHGCFVTLSISGGNAEIKSEACFMYLERIYIVKLHCEVTLQRAISAIHLAKSTSHDPALALHRLKPQFNLRQRYATPNFYSYNPVAITKSTPSQA